MINKLIDGAKIALDSQKSGAGEPSISNLSNTILQAHVITNPPLPIYAVVSIEEPMFDPVQQRNEFLHKPTIRVGRPHARTRNIAVLQQPATVENQIVSACVAGISIVELVVTSPHHEFAVPNENYGMTTAESGDARIVWRQSAPSPDGKIWALVSFPVTTGPVTTGGGIAASELATVVEPLRRPLFRNITPNPFAPEETPEGDAARCMGTIALPGKIYYPIEVAPGIFQKRRKLLTGSGRFVVRENGNTSQGFEWIYCDDTAFDGESTTTDIAQAQYNYDHAICYNLDWSECLIEGDQVEYIARDGYYEVKPLQQIITPVEGQADVIVMEVTPQGENFEGNPITWSWNEIDSQDPTPPEPPNFEAVYLKLKDDHCTPELVKTIGICNDCTSLRVRGVFIREDIKGRRYPMLFELPMLRAGGAIRSRKVSCYYKTEHDECSPVTTQPEMKLIRMNDWRLALSPEVCAVSCSALNDPFAKQKPEPPEPNENE
jgi:hypothetical protein